ncbi:DUF4307 domain-containing protein [Natronosporangium hydrolyticum]|uniref:DUF4307 domain-containing protein n=1 Tax=Natronosporangium hydrolyticum TaxID=2811111 RepID=A0A895Y9F5_9ACTN|nr:DUF4307 domain-containing protein [Natronosporangium hydrolyticum]QSB13951.1 DUF4307 domain-containing protein [Natronosporangium hydrolyticum]
MSETKATIIPPSGSGTAGPAFPPGRYGRRRDPRRLGSRRTRLVVAAAATTAVILAGTVVAVTFGEQYGPGRPYEATVERFYDVTDEQVVVEFSVVVPPGETAVCAVRARSRDGAEVGRDEVRIPAGDEARPQVVHRLATSDRPVTGEVQRCWPEP